MTTIDARRLWLTQLRLECKALDPTGERLVRIDGPDPDGIPSCAVARFADGFVVTFDASADERLMERAAGMSPELFFESSAAAAERLGGGHKLEVSRCRTYAFPAAEMPAGEMPAAPPVIREDYERFGIFVNGREVSGASSSRTNAEAAELWVWTEPGFRRRGYAERAATAWAAEVTGEGRAAFYSHAEDNEPSRHLAAKLGVVHLFDLVQLWRQD